MTASRELASPLWSRQRCPAVADYARHEPEKTLLHEVIRAELVPFLARARSEGAPVARFVEREIRAYLECGVSAHGFRRVHCDACGHDRLVAATRACNDVAPPHLLMVAVQAVAGTLGIDVMAGVGSREQISEAGASKWYFDYKQFWESFPVKELATSIYELPVPFPEKPLTEIKQSHRRRTRVKREFKREVGAAIGAVFQEKFSRVKPIQ